MKVEKTERGFSIIKFKDSYGLDCCLQKSSSATIDHIWLGVKGKPEIMKSDAVKLGLINPNDYKEISGWVDYELPEQVLMHQEMHLNQAQAHELIKHLTKFVETGNL